MLGYLRPHRLQWYVVSEFVKCFVLALAICTLLILAGTLVQRSGELENYGVRTGQIAMLSPFFLPFALTYALPVATLIGAIMAYGRLTAEHEILAAQSAGASVGQLSVFVVLCGFFISVAALWCNDEGIEWGFRSLRDRVLNYESKDLRQAIEKPGASLSVPLEGGQKLHLDMLPHFIDPHTGKEQRPIHLAIFDRRAIVQSWYARNHQYEPPKRNEAGHTVIKFTLYDGQSVDSDEQVQMFREFSLAQILPPLENQIRFGATSGTEGFMTNLRQARDVHDDIEINRLGILEQAAGLAAQAIAGSAADPALPFLGARQWYETRMGTETVTYLQDRSHKKLVEFHRKLALSCIPFSMVFLGIGLGLLSRKSQRLVGFILGTLTTFVLYYPLMVISKELATSQVVPVAVLWAPNAILLLLGVALIAAYQRGYLSGGLWVLRGLRTETEGILETVLSISRAMDRLRLGRLFLFRRRADQHVVQGFLGPLLTVALAVGLFIITLDLVEHGNEVVQAIWQAGQDTHGRSMPRAILDAGIYYGIRALGFMFDFMPVMLLIAGGLAVTVMVRNNEHLVFKSSGADLRRAFLPLLLIGGLISIGIAMLREYAMPNLLMEADRLRPLVYQRNPKTKAMSGQTQDAQGRPVIYEIGSYHRNRHACDRLRIYYVSEDDLVDGRIPRVSADYATWDPEGDRWLLFNLSRRAESGGAASSSLAEGLPPEALNRPGSFLRPRLVADRPPLHDFEFGVAPLGEWRGVLSPSFLDSESLGPGVVRLRDLWDMRNHKADFRAELWRRAFEWLTGILLLSVTIPLLVRQEVRSPLVGVAKCIGFGALYFVLSLAAAELSQQEVLPSWTPVLPHAFFLLLALWSYGLRMET